MTREEKRKIKLAKQEAKAAVKNQRKQEKQDFRSWQRMVQMAKDKGAWIEENN